MKKIFLTLLVFPTLLMAQLSGNYTIGGNGSSYLTVDDAFQALGTEGVAGPVVFTLQPGTHVVYNLHLYTVGGTSETNTITFQSQDLNTDSVTLTGGYLYIYSSYCIIKNMTFNPVNPGTNADGNVMKLYGNHINVQQCKFLGGYSAGSYIQFWGNNIHISDNIFDGNPRSAIYKNSGPSVQDPYIAGNTFLSAANTSVELHDIENATIVGNNFGSANLSSIIASGTSGSLVIEFNTINNPYPNNALNLNVAAIKAVSGNINSSITVRNNFINSQNQNLATFEYNTVNIFHNNFKSGHNCLFIDRSYFVTGTPAVQVKNNVFASYGPYDIAIKESMALSTYTSASNAFKNDLRTIRYVYTDNISVEKYYTLAQWKAISNKETNSIVVGDVYATATDLHTPNAVMLHNTGTPITSVTTDIDGDLRNPATPDIGADEYDMDYTNYTDIEIESIVAPTTTSCDNPGVVLAIKNNGTATVTAFDVTTAINDFRVQPMTVTTSIEPAATVQVNIPFSEVRNNTLYGKLQFQISNPNGTVDNNFANNTQTLTNVMKLGDFDIMVETDNCGDYKWLSIPKIPNATILWSNAATTQKIPVTQTGTYSVTVTNVEGCSITKTIILN